MREQDFELWRAIDEDFVPDIVDVHWSLYEPFRIVVADENSGVVRLRIRFDFPRAVQCVDEGYRLNSGPTAVGIWRARKSDYIAEFRRSASGTMDSFPLNNWLVMSANQCVDVMSEADPVLEIE